MVTKLVSTKKSSYVYLIVKSANQQIQNKTFQSDEIVSVHKTRQGAEEKLANIKPNAPTRTFTRYQIRKFLLTR